MVIVEGRHVGQNGPTPVMMAAPTGSGPNQSISAYSYSVTDFWKV